MLLIQSASAKVYLFSKFEVLRERSSDIASFVKPLVYSIFKMYSVLILVFWFWFTTIHPKCMYKSYLFLKFVVLRKGSSFIAFFVEHSVCSNFKMYSVLARVFYSSSLQLIQSASAKVICSRNFRCSVKEAAVLLLRS